MSARRALVGPRTAPDLHVMTYNIRVRLARVGGRSPDHWNRRRRALRRMLLTEQPSVLGVQEAVFEQAVFIAESLGPTYRRVGRGREADGRGEGTPVFFDARRLKLVEWRQLALSDTPDEPGSRSWGNRVPRAVVSVVLEERATGARFRVLNTHADHRSRTARIRTSQFLSRLVATSGMPVIVMGDFNTSADTAPHAALVANGLVDVWADSATRLTASWGTFPNYRAPMRSRKRIDWILTTPDIEVRESAINHRRFDGVAPSDHLPVQAVLRLPGYTVNRPRMSSAVRADENAAPSSTT